MIKTLILSAAAAGLAAGIFTAVVQHVTTTPMIIEAEKYEGGAAAHDHGAGAPAHDHAAPAAVAAAPTEGVASVTAVGSPGASGASKASTWDHA